MFNVDINFLPQPFELIIYIFFFFFKGWFDFNVYEPPHEYKVVGHGWIDEGKNEYWRE